MNYESNEIIQRRESLSSIVHIELVHNIIAWWQ
nr:MAG TPA: hypothetical protein [Caudoviricetes sp.]DAS76158.1 MAG TPA: hypothetical protein [Caudoviricetes sp.]DAS96506.1 MAG TPA: hypothetical protein [Caudoviricetes sp.]